MDFAGSHLSRLYEAKCYFHPSLASAVIIPSLLNILWTGVYPWSLPTSDILQQCRFLSSCNVRHEARSGMFCMNSSMECSCTRKDCWKINSACAHACNENDVVACMDCLHTTQCVLCSTQCVNVCVDPHCEYSRNKTECQSCVTGYYGQNCNESCSSVCKGSCFEENGYCRTCDSNRHGRECEEICPVLCQICSSQNGSCLKCLDGYTGRDCSIPCPRGFYGAVCANKCPENCDGCDHKTGYCNRGCRPGFFGRHCLKKCPDGTYGPGCIAECPVTCASNRTCHNIDGSCLYGCKEGFSGVHCSVLCSLGKYGENCSQNCSQNCYFGMCNGFSGHCHTCVQGRDGRFCEDVMALESLSAAVDEEAFSIDETILIFLALFSVGAGSWMLLGACIYYKQKIIRDKILKTGKLPRSWDSVINRHPEYFIYSGLRMRSSLLWRTPNDKRRVRTSYLQRTPNYKRRVRTSYLQRTPNYKLGMISKLERMRINREARRLEDFRKNVLQKSVNVKVEELCEKGVENVVEKVLLREKCISAITNESKATTAGGTDHATVEEFQEKVEEQAIKGTIIECDILKEMKDKDSVISSDSMVKGSAINNEDIKMICKEKTEKKKENYETECAAATEEAKALPMNHSDKTVSEKVLPEHDEIPRITLDRVEEIRRSAVIDLSVISGRPLDESNLSETLFAQGLSTAVINILKGCQAVENEQIRVPNVADAEKKCTDTTYGDKSQCVLDGKIMSHDIPGKDKTHLNTAGTENRSSDAAYLENNLLDTVVEERLHLKLTNAENNTTEKGYAQKIPADAERGEPNFSNIKLKEKLPTLTDQDEIRSPVHELSKSTYRTARSSACANCDKHCTCSLMDCQGSTVTTASDQGDPFVPVIRIGEVYHNPQKSVKHKRPTVTLREGAYVGRSMLKVKKGDGFSNETGKVRVQDKHTMNLVRPTYRSKSSRYQSTPKSKRRHRTREHSPENVHEITSTSFHTEAESSDAATSMSRSNTAKTSKGRSDSSTGAGTYSSNSESASSTAVSSSAFSLTAASSEEVPSGKMPLSKSRQQFLQAALERQSQPSLAKTDMALQNAQKDYSSYGVQTSRGIDRDLENNSYFGRHSSQMNIFQRGYKHVVNAMNKVLKPATPLGKQINESNISPSPPIPQRPSSGQFLISRLETWRKVRDFQRRFSSDAVKKDNTRETRSSTTFEKSRLDKTVESASESSSTITNTLWTTSKTKEGSSMTGHSDVWLSRSPSSRPLSASTFSRGTRYSASARISASTSSSSSQYSTSAASISSSGQEAVTTERGESRIDVDKLSAGTRSTTRYPRPYMPKYRLESSTRRNPDLPHRVHKHNPGSILTRTDLPARNVGGPYEGRHRSSLHK